MENLVKWRAGEDIAFFTYDAPTALRLTNDGQTIQTSRGAEVPAIVAPTLWQMVKRARDGKQTQDKHVFPAYRVGYFELREVCPDGSLVVGCHTLPYTELEGNAKKLGYINEGATV